MEMAGSFGRFGQLGIRFRESDPGHQGDAVKGLSKRFPKELVAILGRPLFWTTGLGVEALV